MAPITIGIGSILVALGVGGFAWTWTDKPAPTALIPAGFGLVLIVLGILARKVHLRKHAMHAAVLVGFVGLIGGLVMIVRALQAETIALPVAFGMQVAMAVLCGVFVTLCVKSFIDARRNRQQQAAP